MKIRIVSLLLIFIITQSMMAQLISLGLVEESNVENKKNEIKRGYSCFIPEVKFIGGSMLYAGTPTGLYKCDISNLDAVQWEKLPITDDIIEDFEIRGDTVIVLSRKGLLLSVDGGMTVIIGAKALIDEYPYIVGHSWIMDGWKTITIKQTAYYGWVDSTWQDFKPVDGVDPIAPTLVRPDDMIKYKDFKTITNSYKSNYVLMNWGWDGRYDDIYCTLDGAWAPDPEVSLQYSRKMIHGFGLK